MRGGRLLGALAGVGAAVLAVGCGTQHGLASGGQPVSLAAAVTHTSGETARIAVTISTRSQGMTMSIAEAGVFDFVRSRGTITMQNPVATTEIFFPPTTYLKIPAAAAAAGSGVQGKTWLALPTGASGMPAMAGALLGGPSVGGDPADLLASLTAVSSSVTRLGPGTVRGVPVTGFAVKINPAKAAAKVPASDQAGFLAFLKSLGSAAIGVNVWIDSQNLVRREQLSLTLPGGSGAPAGTSVTTTTDFYDFGVPVHVSAPPAAEIASLSQLNNGGEIAVGSGGIYSGSASGTGSFSGVSASPPPVSGALTADRATAAEQAVAAFWSALGSNSAAAVARTVLPAQRSCVRSQLGGGAPVITVSALHITSARPAGNASATVRFTVQAKAKLGGVEMPVMPQGPGTGVEWLVATEASGHWYVNIVRSAALIFGGTCS